MPVRLFVGNIPYDTTDDHLREHFSEVGPLSFVHIPKDRETGRSRGFAFVEFMEAAQADEAIRRFNTQPFRGRPLAINQARSRDESPPPRSGSASPQLRSRPDWLSSQPPDSPSPYADSGTRDFGPDAPARRNRKEKQRTHSPEQRIPKPHKRERRGKIFYEENEDD